METKNRLSTSINLQLNKLCETTKSHSRNIEEIEFQVFLYLINNI